MISGILIVLAITAVGTPLAAWLNPAARKRSFVALSYLLGASWCAVALFVLALAHAPWSRASALAACVLPSAVLAPFAFMRMRAHRSNVSQASKPAISATVVDAVTASSICGFAVYATLAPMWEWDFWSLWGMVGRAFYEHGGIDWDFLSRPENVLARSDYSAGKSAFRPILHPLLLDVYALLNGTWDDRTIGLLFAAFAAAVLLLVRDELEADTRSPLFAAVVTLGMAGVTASKWVGNPEGMISAYMMVAILVSRRAVKRSDGQLLALGALFAGLAAFTKDEGTAFVVAFLLAAAFACGRNVRLLFHAWPAVVIPLPWFFLRRAGGVQSYFASTSLLDRVASRAMHPGELMSALAANLPDRPLFWIGVSAAILILFRRALRDERFTVVAVCLQLLFFIGAYVATPFNVLWHVQTSWVRLLYQLAPVLMYIAIVALLPVIGLAKEPEVRETEALVNGA